MSEAPKNAVLRSDVDASSIGLYASLGAGGLMLAYAIYKVTVANVSSDYAFLTLGVSTAIIAFSVIGLHEWLRYSKGIDREEDPIEEYAGAAGVLMGSLSAVWLSRFVVFFAGPEKEWIEIQDGEIWMPVWLAALQTLCLLIVMEISARSIIRHSLGTLPRTVVVLAPISLAFSGAPIWMDYSGGELEVFLTLSFLLLMSASVVYSLRLDRSSLYLFSSGMTVGFPLYLAWGTEIEYASLLVPFIVLIGITATDQSLSRKMVENGSGLVVATILFCQIVATANESSFVVAGIVEIAYPFGLTFWLWVALLVGWFAPTTMQRTPAMPIGLALALALLSGESALVGWSVGIVAFIYLETRPYARDWVVRGTYVAMLVSWLVSSALGAEEGGALLDTGGFTLTVVDGAAFVLFPALLLLGIWGQHRGRLGFFDGPSLLLLMASLNQSLLRESHVLLGAIIAAAVLFQLDKHLRGHDRLGIEESVRSAFIVAPMVLALAIEATEVALEIEAFDDSSLAFIRSLPGVSALVLFGLCRFRKSPDENLMLRPEMTAILLLILIFLGINLDEHFAGPTEAIWLTLSCVTVAVALLAIEGGAFGPSTPLDRLVGICYLIPISVISAVIVKDEGGNLMALVTRDLLIIAAPVLVNFKLKTLTDLSEEARALGTVTLLVLLVIGLTDISGGLLAIPVYALAVHRASKHASTAVLISLPVVAVIYASTFHSTYDENSVLWPILSGLAYLGETSDLLIIEVPRWASLLLASLPIMVAVNMPAERNRVGGSRYGPEQLFGPAMAGMFAVALLLPDERMAPLFIVTLLTAGAWKNGIVNWFWLTPVASFWATDNLISLLLDSGLDFSPSYSAIAPLVGGIVGLGQYVLLENGVLLSNVKDPGALNASTKYLGAVSRGFGYLFTLMTGDISWALPFLSSLVAGLDGIRNGIPWLLHVSVPVQTFTLALWIHNGEGGNAIDAALWPILVGLVMLQQSWVRRNPFQRLDEDRHGNPFDFEKNTGLFGSGFFLFFSLIYWIEEGTPEVFGYCLILLSAHHMILGFSRDHPWRRMFSLVGMPLGLVITGSFFGDLVMVMMLFLAALTLIGQAVLYSSKGGLEIGSTKEGASPIVSNIGVPYDIRIPDDAGVPDDAGIPEDLPEEDASEEFSESSVVSDVVSTPDPRFVSDEVPFQVRLDSTLVDRLQKSVDAEQSVDLSKWIPVLEVNSNGVIVLKWERAGAGSDV